MRTTLDLNRRGFLLAGGALAGMAMSGEAAAAPFFASRKLPIGIQLYTLGPDAAKDLDGTLAAVAKIGYRAVELAGLYGRTPAEFKASLDKAGLVATSAHISARGTGPEGSLEADVGKVAEMLNVLGVKNAVMPSPYVPDRVLEKVKGTAGPDYYRTMMGALSADDYRFNADFLNKKAAALKASGIALGYHNHNFELAPQGDTTGLDIMFQGTDPALVGFEADIGWIAAAGVDPAAFLAKHKGRVRLMHVKDIKASTQPNFELRMDPTEVGSGRLDWKTLLPAAHAAGVRFFYVEQEPPFAHPRLEAAKISHDYLARVQA